MGVSVWVRVESDGADDEDGGDVEDAVERASANFCTSSLRTRPSLPVPMTELISTSKVFRRPRTAGVASELCLLPVWASSGCSSCSFPD